MSYDLRDFQADVLDRSRHTPVLVDFWAPWCGPCKMLGPVLERLAEQASGRWILVKVNTEEHPDLATLFEIRSIPCVKLFVNGKEMNQFMGALPESEIRRWLTQALPSPHAQVIAEAHQQLEKGAFRNVVDLLDPVVADTGDAEARVCLAQALLHVEATRVEALLLRVTPDSPEADRADALRALARVLTARDSAIQQSPEPARGLFNAGVEALRRGDYEEALGRFIEVLEQQKDFGGGAARDACKSIFRLLGPRHALTEKFHRSFSSAIHA